MWDSELRCGDYLELVSIRVEHDRPAVNGVRCQDARRLLEGLSSFCTWMPSTERFCRCASHQPVASRIARLHLRLPLAGNPGWKPSCSRFGRAAGRAGCSRGVRERSLAFHAVGCPKRHGDSQIIQCRQRRVDEPSTNALNGDLRRPAYANASLSGM
jgi:hypothetical protein